MISFIIPAHNEERFIGSTLSALHAAAGELNAQYEIIVVDDGSTDATATLAERRGARVVRVCHRQISAARNAGARQAHGDLLVFVDADTLVPGAVLAAAVRAMHNGAVGGGARARFDGRVPQYARTLAWLWRWFQRFARVASGCFIFCTARAFGAAGGFDESLYAAEDVVFSRRLHQLGRFEIIPEMVITSGRTVRSHTGIEALKIVTAFLLRGPRFFNTRRGPWYGKRGNDIDPSA